MPERARDTALLASLTAAVALMALAGLQLRTSSALEAVSVVTGALCVWLTVRESIWNFPLGLANVATFCVVFFGARLYADAGLQVVYFVLGLAGWYLWLHGGARRTALRVSRVGRTEALAVVIAGALLTAVLWLVLHHAGGSATFFDALTTSISLCAQWLLNRKYVESWYAWIAADLVYIPLYAYKGLYLTAALYAVFLVMATLGLLRWRASWLSAGEPAPRPASAPVEAAA
jgi:nicotinamide mononucleotide transporter